MSEEEQQSVEKDSVIRGDESLEGAKLDGDDSSENVATDNPQQQLAELHEKYVRLAAEFDNFRKRTEKEKSDLRKFGSERVLHDILPVLDSFEKATEEVVRDDLSADGANIFDGLQLVKKMLIDYLQKQGVEEVPSVGKPFDPNLHQAIQRIEADDVEDDVVAQEFAKGYTLNGRLMRAAVVSVKVPKASN